MVKISELISASIPPKHRTFRLTEDFTVKINGTTYLVPKGFVSDGASVPRIFWSIIPRDGVYTPAAVMHDWLYKAGVMSKKDADIIFYKIMRECEVPLWKRRAMYCAVKWFGGWAWRKHRKNDKKERGE